MQERDVYYKESKATIRSSFMTGASKYNRAKVNRVELVRSMKERIAEKRRESIEAIKDKC